MQRPARTLRTICFGSAPTNGIAPVHSRYSTTPSENRSDRWSTFSFNVISGDMYCHLPTTIVSVCSVTDDIATPKSSSLTVPS